VFFPFKAEGIAAQLFYLSPPLGQIILLLQVLFYLLAWLGSRLANQKETSRLARILYLPAFLTNSNFAALKGFFQFIRGKQSHVWERAQRRQT
ncbi:MAG: hypothetical protein AB1649_30490, partial [Chloroflexota bacterium]